MGRGSSPYERVSKLPAYAFPLFGVSWTNRTYMQETSAAVMAALVLHRVFSMNTLRRTDTMIQVYRGEVYLATLLGEGCEQKGTRPVLIVQNNVGNRFSPTTIIAPITSSIKKCSLPVHVPVFNSSLFKDSIVLCEQIQVMDKSRLEKPLCRLTDKEMKAVNKALAVSVGDYELPDKR